MYINKNFAYQIVDGYGSIGYEDDKLENTLGKYDVLSKINASNSLYDGSGINIGVLEAADGGIDGLPDPTLLSNLNITKRTNSKEISEHATAVTQCISWLAPNALYYCSSVISNDRINSMTPIQWMIDNKVNVMNMSLGIYDSYLTGNYFSEITRFYDKLVIDNFLCIVVAAGNDTTSLRSPGICNNVISVGATNFECDDKAYFSSYVAPYSIAKPNIMAPGENIFFDDNISLGNKKYSSGTSFSAPIVTGAIAQLMQKRNILKIYPEAVQAVLYNTANSNMLKSYSSYAGFDTRNGSGMLDIQNALDNIYNYNVRTISNDNYYKLTITMANVYVASGDTLNANLNWLINYDETKRLITDFDLYIYDSKGNRVAYSSSASNNSELCRYYVTTSDYYQICLYQYGTRRNQLEHCALSWSIS